MEIISDLFEQITKLGPEVLTAVVCIVLGYVIRYIPQINNKLIPVFCTVFGGIIYPFLGKVESVSSDIKNPKVALALIGLVIGFLAWTFHNSVISKVETKFPFVKNLLDKNSGNTQTIKKDEVVNAKD